MHCWDNRLLKSLIFQWFKKLDIIPMTVPISLWWNNFFFWFNSIYIHLRKNYEKRLRTLLLSKSSVFSKSKLSQKMSGLFCFCGCCFILRLFVCLVQKKSKRQKLNKVSTTKLNFIARHFSWKNRRNVIGFLLFFIIQQWPI